MAVFWLNTQEGTVTNAEGAFTLDRVSSTNQLQVPWFYHRYPYRRIQQKNLSLYERRSRERLEGVELTQRKKALQNPILRHKTS